MPRLEPFVAARPDPAQVDVARFLAPPYDVISPTRRAELADLGPNIVELTLPEGETPGRYADAAKRLQAWRSDGTLAIDEAPALYLYEQSAEVAGIPTTVRGLFAEVSLDEDDPGAVKPHEKVYENVVGDRLELLKATEADLEPILSIYDGSTGDSRSIFDQIEATEPILDVEAACCADHHRLWRIDDPDQITRLTKDLETRTMVIADGHHRWTTARRAAREQGQAGSMLMLLQDVGAKAPGLLPIHRVIPGLTLDEVLDAIRPFFDLDEVLDPAAASLEDEENVTYLLLEGERMVRAAVSEPAVIAALMPVEASAQKRRLDISILHEAVFDEMLGGVEAAYAHTPADVREKIAGGGVGVLVRPTPLKAVLEIAGNGELMPRKSTFFLPKPLSGLVIRPHDANRTDGTGVPS